MPAPAVIHMIGTVALITILAFVILHVSSTLNIMRHDNLLANFMRIADSIKSQTLYALETNNNVSLRLVYPAYAAINQPYNIILGTGSAIKSRYPVFNVVKDENILYVVITTPDNTIHFEEEILNTTEINKNIIVENDPVIFGSTTLTYINITITDNTVYIRVDVRGVLAR